MVFRTKRICKYPRVIEKNRSFAHMSKGPFSGRKGIFMGILLAHTPEDMTDGQVIVFLAIVAGMFYVAFRKWR